MKQIIEVQNPVNCKMEYWVKMRLIAYPGWRWRIEDGFANHELISNIILRNWDRLKCWIMGGAYDRS